MTDKQTDLDQRMLKYTNGQVTWPEPKLGKYCNQCRFFFTGDVRTTGKGRCDLVRLHHRSPGVSFLGTEAIACPKFEAGIHEGNPA